MDGPTSNIVVAVIAALASVATTVITAIVSLATAAIAANRNARATKEAEHAAMKSADAVNESSFNTYNPISAGPTDEKTDWPGVIALVVVCLLLVPFFLWFSMTSLLEMANRPGWLGDVARAVVGPFLGYVLLCLAISTVVVVLNDLAKELDNEPSSYKYLGIGVIFGLANLAIFLVLKDVSGRPSRPPYGEAPVIREGPPNWPPDRPYRPDQTGRSRGR
jgi:hypothetical protein